MYLIIGANGYLGSYIIKNILENTKEKIVATARDISECEMLERVTWTECEVTKQTDVQKIAKLTNDHNDIKVVYLAAYHKPDLVQKNPRMAWNINITALSNVINNINHVKCFYYASTDSVYGNSIDGYHFKESDPLKPENIYGRQKQVAEAIVTGYGYNVVRYPFLIGPSLLKKKKHFYDEIAEQIHAGNKFEMFADSYRSSLDFNTAAYLLIRLMETYSRNYPAVLNVCGDDDLSKYDVGIEIAHKENCAVQLISPIKMKDVNGIFTAPRAISTLMDNSEVKRILGLSKITLSL